MRRHDGDPVVTGRRTLSLTRRALAIVLPVAAACGACGGDDIADSRPIVEIFAPYRDAEADLFAAALETFEERSGVEVRYVGSADFVDDLTARLVGDDRPDVAIVPQPGVIEALADRGVLVEHGPATIEALDDSGLDRDVLTLGQGDVAVPYRTTLKSLVWYRPAVFERYGWQVPETLGALDELVVEIDDGDSGLAPWCFSIASGSATGWPATDWAEDLILRLHGADVYDEWRDGAIEFRDERIVEAFQLLARLTLVDGRVAGGRRALTQTDVTETGLPMFGDEPECAMYKQASFAYDWFPDEPEFGTDGDVDAFVLPGVGDDRPPLVVGGDSAVAFDDRDEVDQLMAFLASPEGAAPWASAGGYLSLRDDVDERYFRRATRPLVTLLRSGGTLRFDASDTMEPDFGAGVFWDEMATWMSGTDELAVVLQRLDDARSEPDE